MASIKNIIKQTNILSLNDTINRAIGLMRISGVDTILVSNGYTVDSYLTEQAIAGYISAFNDIEQAKQHTIEKIVSANLFSINSESSFNEAAEMFGKTDADVLPVFYENRQYVGAIYRRDLIGYLTKSLRPPSIAGMATPLGVYLTTGPHRAGAGNFGLFLTGVSMSLMITISTLFVNLVQNYLAFITNIRFDLMAITPPQGGIRTIYDAAAYFFVALNIIVMLLLLRWSPLSGFHAAEHMTVHAIELGEELSSRIVQLMPRVHPRCGTNLLAGAGVFIIISSSGNSDIVVIAALIAVVLGWRKVGGWLQSMVTTSNPNEYQLQNGINTGQKLIDEYLASPNRQQTAMQRIWNMGFLQTASGMAVSMIIFSIIGNLLNIPSLKL